MQQRVFDIKNANKIVWNGQTVMSRTETGFLSGLFARVSDLSASSVLEVGFGLGISARLIQATYRPRSHDIVEIDQTIFVDLCRFAAKAPSVRPIRGDFWTLRVRKRYDFIFYDTFEYISADEQSYADDWEAWARRMAGLLAPGGTICVPVFETRPPPKRVRGPLRLARREVFRVPPYTREDGSTSRTGAFECWKRRSERSREVQSTVEIYPLAQTLAVLSRQ